MKEEPDFRDFLEALIDWLFSNFLVTVLRKKIAARSFDEFFNRITGVGFLLLALGSIYLFVEWWRQNELVFFGYNLENASVLVVGFLGVWVILGIVNLINEGVGVDRAGIFSGFGLEKQTDLTLRGEFGIELVYIVFGLLSTAIVLISLTGPGSSILDTIKSLTILGLIFGMLMISTGYLFRGVAGLSRILWQERRWRRK